MNRLLMVGIAVAMLSPHTLWARQAKKEWKTLLDKRTFSGEKGGKLPYRLRKPDDYDAKKSYPLVGFLHGAGERFTWMYSVQRCGRR